MAEVRTYIVPEGLDGMRVDAAIATMMGLSRTAAAKLAEAGDIESEAGPLGKAERIVGGSAVFVRMAEPVQLRPQGRGQAIPLLYEDSDIVVVDKPAGFAAHPSLGFDGPDVLGALLERGTQLTSYGPPERKGIVHRLDVGTSGCMVVAKSERAYVALKDAFRQRTVKKTYHALVQGHPDPLRGTIDAPIGHARTKEWKMAIREDGRPSITHYATDEAMAGGTLLEVHLETGRTHQIRVHMAAIGHPLVGDGVYGCDPRLAERLGLERQWLHAVRLGFIHPGTGEAVTFESPYPPDLEHALEAMREGVFR